MNEYKSYKNCEVDWIGEIPTHWKVDRLKNIFSFGTGLSITKKNLLDAGLPCVSYGEIHSKYGFEVNPEIHYLKCVEKEYLQTSKKSFLKKGDFIFADTSEDIEGCGNFTYLNSDTQVFAGYHTIAAKPKRVINYRYTAYLLDSVSFRHQFRSNVVGIKVYSITQGLLNRLKIFFPSSQEQTLIANYLDTKTQAIDKKVNLLEMKIGYYKELRKSLINESVTKGLDKKVKFKDSGIDWIGQIPAHWKVMRGKDIFKEISRKNRPDLPLLAASQKQGVVLKSMLENRSMEAQKSFEIFKWVKPKDFVISLRSFEGGIETAFYEGIISPAYTVFNFRKIGNASFYFTHLFKSACFINFLQSSITGIRDGQSVKFIELERAFFAIPPVSEQEQIAYYLTENTSKIDKIITNIQTQIITLKELRKTLINDAVTGKIKVIQD